MFSNTSSIGRSEASYKGGSRQGILGGGQKTLQLHPHRGSQKYQHRLSKTIQSHPSLETRLNVNTWRSGGGARHASACTFQNKFQKSRGHVPPNLTRIRLWVVHRNERTFRQSRMELGASEEKDLVTMSQSWRINMTDVNLFRSLVTSDSLY